LQEYCQLVSAEYIMVCFSFFGVLLIFTALQRMQGGIVRRKISLCLSVKCVDCDKMEEKSVQIFIRYERSFSLVF